MDIDREIQLCCEKLEKTTENEKRITNFTVAFLFSSLICSCTVIVFWKFNLIHLMLSYENILLLEIIAMAILLATIKIFSNSHSKLKKQLLLVEALEWFKTRTKKQQEALTTRKIKI